MAVETGKRKKTDLKKIDLGKYLRNLQRKNSDKKEKSSRQSFVGEAQVL